MKTTLYVSKDAASISNFTSIQSAIDSIPLDNNIPCKIHIKSGTYYEKLVLNRSYVTLEGDREEDCILTFDDHAYSTMADGSKMGTFRSSTLFIDANNITLSHLTIQNSSGWGKDVGQAIALYADGDQLYINNCRILGHQDTLFTGPLPPTPIEPNGFVGPKENDPRIVGRQLYHNCYIEGDIDFIFGSACAWFEHCTIYSHALPSYPDQDNRNMIHGYITAASTPKDEKFGYIFHCCHITGNCPKGSVFLGRPWREYAKVIFLKCTIDDHIHPLGFHDWNKQWAHNLFTYAEGQNDGDGADTSSHASYVHRLSLEEINSISMDSVLFNNNNWEPI